MAAEGLDATWATCVVEGCHGSAVEATGQCLAHMSAEELRERFASATPPVALDGRGARFDWMALARVLSAIPLDDDRRVIGAAQFDGATFHSDATFDATTFTGPVSFGGAPFEDSARFGGAVLESDAVFGDAPTTGWSW